MIRHILKCFVMLAMTYPSLKMASQDPQMMVVDVDVVDLAYWEATDRLVVCTSPDTTHGNSLLIVNPYTGEVESSTFIGSIPGRLALSSDQKFAYVAIRAANKIVRFDLENKIVDQTIVLGVDPVSLNHTYSPEGIVCSRELPERVAIIRGLTGFSAPSSVVIYHDEINQHDKSNSIRLNTLLFTETDQLYGGYNNILHKLSTTGSQITSEEVSFGVANFSTFGYLDGYIYSRNGYKIDILSGEPSVVHEFQIDCSILSRPTQMAATDSLAYLVGDRFNAFGQHCMRITENYPPYDQISEFPLSPRIDEVARIITWGNNGVALKVQYRNEDQYKLAIMRTCEYTLGITPTLTHDGIPGACYEEYVTLRADSTYDKVFWSSGEYAHQVHIAHHKRGEYFYQIADSTGCLSPPSNVLDVRFGSMPDVPQIIPDVDTVEICTGEIVTIGSLNGFNKSYWSNGSTSTYIDVDSSGMYALQFISQEGCAQPILDTIVVIQRPHPSPGKPELHPSDTTLCRDQTITLFASQGYHIYRWMVNDQITQTFTDTLFLSGADDVVPPVRVQVLDSNACQSVFSDYAIIRFVEPAPAPTITRNANQLTASGSGLYKWFLNGMEIIGETGKTITVAEPGFYQALRLVTGCHSEISLPYNFE